MFFFFSNIEEIGKDDRKDVVGQTEEGCAPLFMACKNGSSDVVEYLLSFCGADIEQRGVFEVPEEGVSHSVTPLWCAAVAGRLSVVKVLLKFGADVDAGKDSRRQLLHDDFIYRNFSNLYIMDSANMSL